MRYVLRRLAREKGFTLTVLFLMSVGIGTTTLVFSVVNGVLLRPLNFANVDRLYVVQTVVPKLEQQLGVIGVNARHFDQWRNQCRACDGMTLAASAAFTLTDAGAPEQIGTLLVSSEFFSILGVEPQLGRVFSPRDSEFDHEKEVVITDSLWRRKFGARSDVIGRLAHVDGDSLQIVGVLRHDFRFPTGEQLGKPGLPQNTEMFRPFAMRFGQMRGAGNFNFSGIVRLKPGVSAQSAEAEMTGLIAEFSREADLEMRPSITPMQEQMTRRVRNALFFVLGAVGLLLIIICINTGSLMFVRALKRIRDGAIKSALGASRIQIIRDFCWEAFVLTAAGGLLGLGVAYTGWRLLQSVTSINVPRLGDVQLDLTVVLFAIAAALLAGGLSAALPTALLWRSDLEASLRASSSSVTTSTAQRLGWNVLVGAEIALSSALLVTAGLFLISVFRLLAVDKGFDADHVLTFQMTLPQGAYAKPNERNAFYPLLVDKLRAIPGVSAVGLASALPLRGESQIDVVTREGDIRPESEQPVANYRLVSPAYFEAMGIRLRQGRIFALDDRERTVAVVSERVAKQVWPGENPVGRNIIRREGGGKTVLFEIVGVVADVRTKVALEDAESPIVYMPYWRQPPRGLAVVLRTSMDPLNVVSAARQAVWSADARIPLARVLTMQDIVMGSIAQRRLETAVACVFAIIGLVLTATGVFGAVSHSVGLRRKEIGIRIVVGGLPSNIRSQIVRQGMVPVVIGLAVGMAGALMSGSLVSGFLYGTSVRDPIVFSSVAGVVGFAAFLGCYLPARSASTVDPLITLRLE